MVSDGMPVNESVEVRPTAGALGGRLVYVRAWATTAEHVEDVLALREEAHGRMALSRLDTLLAWCGAEWLTTPEVAHSRHAAFASGEVLTRVTGAIGCGDCQ